MSHLLFEYGVKTMLHLLEGLIGRELKTIETSMSFWVRIMFIVLGLLNCEFSHHVSIALQVLKTQDRHSGWPCTIVQQIS